MKYFKDLLDSRNSCVPKVVSALQLSTSPEIEKFPVTLSGTHQFDTIVLHGAVGLGTLVLNQR